MGDNSASSEDPPKLQEVLDALDDPDCRAILRQAAAPMTAKELANTCDIPTSTLYRKLDLLTSASLIREHEAVNPKGGRLSKYERDFEDVTISMNENQALSVDVERPPRTPDEQLTNIWSEMGDEL
ncbi:MAG: helix-turn-helix domain-containing protein [Halopenitus sp.]